MLFSYWQSLTAVWNDEGIAATINRIVLAGNAGRYGEMGAECRLAGNLLDGWYAEVDIPPTPEIEALDQALWDELALLFSACSGGTATALDWSAPHLDIIEELIARIDTATSP